MAARSRARRATRSSSSSGRRAEAIAAAVAAQRSLAAEPWPPDAPIRVRMGVHSGEAAYPRGLARRASTSTGPPGSPPSRTAARSCVSDVTRSLVRDEALEGIAFRDLGSHRLKDLDAPERLHQVLADGLRSEFPPLRTIDARPTTCRPAHLVRRPRRRAGRGRRPPGHPPPRHADRPRRHRQDATLARGGRRGGRRLPRRRLLRAARRGPRPEPGGVADRECARARGVGHRPARDLVVDWLATRTALSSSTTSSRSWTRRRSSPTCSRRVPGLKLVVTVAGGAPRLRRAGVPGPGPAGAAGPEPALGARAAAAAGAGPRGRGRGPRPLRGCPPVHRAGDGGQARLRGHQRQRAGRRRDQRAAARDAARHRARGGPGQAAVARRDPGPPDAPAGRARRRARGTSRNASRRSAARSPGATTSSTTATAASSIGCRSFAAASTSTPPRRSAARPRSSTGTSSTASWSSPTRASCAVDDDRGEPRFRMLETIREFAARHARGPRRDGPDPGASPAPGSGARRAGDGRAVRPRPADAGSTGWSSSTTTSEPCSTGPSRPRTPRPRSGSPSRCGASGRCGATCSRRGAGST